MTNDLLIILCGAVAAFTVYDLLKAAFTAGGLAQSHLCRGWATASAMLAPDVHTTVEDRPAAPAAAPKAASGNSQLRAAGSVSSTLVYLIGVISPLFGLGLAVHPLI